MDKLPEQKIKMDGKLYKWLDNYWYHYKWPTIITAFFVIAFLIMGLQLCGKERVDAYIIYAGPHYFENNEVISAASDISAVMSEDHNGDGIKNASIINLYTLTEEQIKAEKDKYNAEMKKLMEKYKDLPKEEQERRAKAEYGGDYYYNPSFFKAEETKFYQLVSTGEYSVCILDPALYATIKDRLVPLSEIFDEIPATAMDEYAIKLSETDFYKASPNIGKLPTDTVLCLLRQTKASLLNQEDAKKQHDYYVTVFKDIVEFKIPE